MSRLDELIRVLCPNGVQAKPLEELCSLITKQTGFDYSNKIKDSLLRKPIAGAVPYIQTKFFSGKSFDYNTDYYVPSHIVSSFPKITLSEKAILFSIVGASIGNIGLFPGDRVCFLGGAICVAKLLPQYNANYLFYYLTASGGQAQIMKKIKGAGQATVTVEDIRNIMIPLPPLEVQQKIVRILDSFTTLTAELQSELQAELQARRQQYEHYSDRVLNIANESEHSILSVEECIISLKTGLNPRQNFKLNESGSVFPYITGKDIFGNTINVSERTDLITPDALSCINRRAKLEAGLILFASTGTGTVGRMAVVDEYNNDWGISETLYAIKVKPDRVIPKYLMYALYSKTAREQFEPKISKGSVPHLKVIDLLRVNVAIPSIEEQVRIVNIMERFDYVSNELSSRLLAEIEARQKQYEYYRDKLLSFKETQI